MYDIRSLRFSSRVISLTGSTGLALGTGFVGGGAISSFAGGSGGTTSFTGGSGLTAMGSLMGTSSFTGVAEFPRAGATSSSGAVGGPATSSKITGGVLSRWAA